MCNVVMHKVVRNNNNNMLLVNMEESYSFRKIRIHNTIRISKHKYHICYDSFISMRKIFWLSFTVSVYFSGDNCLFIMSNIAFMVPFI